MDYPKSRASELGLSNGKFTNGIPGLQPASVDDALFMNELVDSILAVQVAGGQANAEKDTTQLLKGILALIVANVVTPSIDSAYADISSKAASTSWTRGLLGSVGLGTINTGSYAADIDDVTLVAGMYYVNASTLGTFPNGVAPASSFIFHRVYGSAGFQLWNLPLSNRTFIRARANSAWGAWSELLRSDKVVTPATDPTFADNTVNPASTSWVRGALSSTAGMLALFPFASPPSGWLKANGAAIPISAYATLAGLLYCGDTNNASAAWGYRCSNQSSPTTTRSTTGNYIVLPDARGEFLRAWDDGRGVDGGRSLWATQAGQVLYHNHGGSIGTVGDHQHVSYSLSPFSRTGELAGSGTTGYMVNSRDLDYGSLTSWGGSHTHGLTINATGGPENLVRNLAALVCIKY